MKISNRLRPTFRHEALWMRLTARAILAGWLLPLLFALFVSWGATPAQAQDNARQTVVVLDFATGAGIDPLLGRKAADALAVELQRSGQYDVVSRQRIEEAVGQQAGLQPPFNDTAQVRLAQAVGASSVFSGSVSRVEVSPGSLARVGLQVRQLDVLTGDYVNGTFAFESTEQKLSTVANEVLVDEAINKAAFSSVRSMRQTNLPQGTVLNTTRDDVELSIGARNGVATGQRYTVLRDVYDPARRITDRVKIGEVTITKVQNDQSVAVLSGGGAAGVRTGDRVRQIFVASAYPITSVSATGNNSPVTAPPVRNRAKGGLFGKSQGLLGIVGLVALASLTGLGGGNGGSNKAPSATQPREANPTSTYPAATFSFQQQRTGISILQSLQSQGSVGYLVYRGTAAGFAPDPSNLQAFIDGRTLGASARVSFSDPLISTPVARTVTITSVDSTNGAASINVSTTDAADDADSSFEQTEDEINFTYTQRPLRIGQTYFYKVVRIGAQRSSSTTGGTGGTGGGTTTNTITLLPVISAASSAVGGYTPLVRPVIIRDQTKYDTDNFSVRINSQSELDLLNADLNYLVPGNATAATGVDQFRIEVSTSASFSSDATFISPDLPPPTANASGDIVFNLGNIRIPDTSSNPYQPGETPLYIRVLSRRSTDVVPIFRVSPTLVVAGSDVTGVDAVGSSRFVKAAKSGGIGIGRASGGLGVASASGGGVRVLRPTR